VLGRNRPSLAAGMCACHPMRRNGLSVRCRTDDYFQVAKIIKNVAMTSQDQQDLPCDLARNRRLMKQWGIPLED
jgi:hypothetical protein